MLIYKTTKKALYKSSILSADNTAGLSEEIVNDYSYKFNIYVSTSINPATINIYGKDLENDSYKLLKTITASSLSEFLQLNDILYRFIKIEVTNTVEDISLEVIVA